MYAIKKYWLAVSLVCTACMAYAQNPQAATLKWSCNESVELGSNTPGSVSFEIRTSSTEIKITTGSTTKVFSVTSVTGEWPDVNAAGSLTYGLLFGQKAGSAILKRENGVWEFTLDFSAHPQGIRQKFVLSGFQQID